MSSDIRQGTVIELNKNHRIYCGDSRGAGVRNLFGKDKIEMVFCSPPYLEKREYTGMDATAINNAHRDAVAVWTIRMKAVIERLSEYVADHVQIFVVLGDTHIDRNVTEYWETWIKWMVGNGWNYFGHYIWDKGTPMPIDPSCGRLWMQHEHIFHFNHLPVTPKKTVQCITAGNPRSSTGQRRPDGSVRPLGTPGSTCDYKVLGSIVNVYAYGQRLGHPAPFPWKLPLEFLKTWPVKNVYDPFAGSGSTMEAAYKLGIDSYGSELSPEYCQIMIDRFGRINGGHNQMPLEL
jgi:DNA modification methylase